MVCQKSVWYSTHSYWLFWINSRLGPPSADDCGWCWCGVGITLAYAYRLWCHVGGGASGSHITASKHRLGLPSTTKTPNIRVFVASLVKLAVLLWLGFNVVYQTVFQFGQPNLWCIKSLFHCSNRPRSFIPCSNDRPALHQKYFTMTPVDTWIVDEIQAYQYHLWSLMSNSGSAWPKQLLKVRPFFSIYELYIANIMIITVICLIFSATSIEYWLR